MFLHAWQYKAAIDDLIEGAESVDIAVAFWGKGAEALIPEGKKVRVICNLGMGGTNPDVIETLQWYEGVTIRNLDSLHAKLVLGHDRAILGSANFSTNGLNLEGDAELSVRGWYEAGYAVEDAYQLDQMKKWFDARWKEAEDIDDELMAAAKEAWARRSVSRPVIGRRKRLFADMHEADVARRNIVIAFWREDISEEGLEEAEKYNLANAVESVVECYEDWFDKLEVGQTVIDAYIGTRGGVKVSGPYKIFDARTKRRRRDYKKNEEMTVHFAHAEEELLQFKAGQIRSEMEALIKKDPFRYLPPDSESRVLRVEDFLEMAKPQ